MQEQSAIYSSSMIEHGSDKEVVNTVFSASFGAKLKRWNLAIRNWIYPAHLEGDKILLFNSIIFNNFVRSLVNQWNSDSIVFW